MAYIQHRPLLNVNLSAEPWRSLFSNLDGLTVIPGLVCERLSPTRREKGECDLFEIKKKKNPVFFN